jgi:hypothetical protein
MYNVIQVREVSIVQASATCEFPDALDGVQLRAVGGEVIEREAIRVPLPPLPMKACMMVFRVVGNDHDASFGSGAGRLQVLEKLPAGDGVELIRLAPKDELTIAQADGAEIPDTAPGGVMKEHRVLGFRRDPHAAARTVLLKVHFVHGPKIDSGIKV